VALAPTRSGGPEFAPLQRLDATLAACRASDETALLLAGPLRWLLDDLRGLAASARAAA
jgi:hypothetical protein